MGQVTLVLDPRIMQGFQNWLAVAEILIKEEYEVLRRQLAGLVPSGSLLRFPALSAHILWRGRLPTP